MKRTLAPITATTRRAMLIVPLIFAGPFTNSASHQAHALSSPKADGHWPLPPNKSRVIASVQRIRASSTITTQRTQFSLFPSARCTSKARPVRQSPPSARLHRPKPHPPGRGPMAAAKKHLVYSVSSVSSDRRNANPHHGDLV